MFAFYDMCFKEKNPMTKGRSLSGSKVKIVPSNTEEGKTAPARRNEKHQNGALFDHHFLVVTARENQNEVF